MGFQDMPIKTYVDFGWISYFHWNCGSDKLNPVKSGRNLWLIFWFFQYTCKNNKAFFAHCLIEVLSILLQQINISPHERDFTIDLQPYMNPGSYTVSHVSTYIKNFSSVDIPLNINSHI